MCVCVCAQPAVDNTKDLDDRDVKDKLRTILKRLGKLKCSKEVEWYRKVGCGPERKVTCD